VGEEQGIMSDTSKTIEMECTSSLKVFAKWTRLTTLATMPICTAWEAASMNVQWYQADKIVYWTQLGEASGAYFWLVRINPRVQVWRIIQRIN